MPVASAMIAVHRSAIQCCTAKHLNAGNGPGGEAIVIEIMCLTINFYTEYNQACRQLGAYAPLFLISNSIWASSTESSIF